jgi:GNAT superfamily N-acetyltransferase
VPNSGRATKPANDAASISNGAPRCHGAGGNMEIRPLNADRRADAGELFDSNPTTRGCWCMWFLLTSKEAHSGWGDGNRRRFEQLATEANPPAGLLAYRDGKPVGWCAVGPRSRYTRALRSPILVGRDPDEDDAVWLVPCFFVRSGARRAGVTRDLLTSAVELARRHGATAIEGFPLAGSGPHTSDRYLGTEPLFAACGFVAVARPSPRRVVMRLDLVKQRQRAHSWTGVPDTGQVALDGRKMPPTPPGRQD